MINYQHAVAVVDAYMQAMTAGDWDAVLELYADDATLEDPVGSAVKQGKTAISEFYFGIGDADLTCERSGPVRFVNGELTFPFHCIMRSPEGSMKIAIIDHFVLNEHGKIKQMRAFWSAETTTPYQAD